MGLLRLGLLGAAGYQISKRRDNSNQNNTPPQESYQQPYGNPYQQPFGNPYQQPYGNPYQQPHYNPAYPPYNGPHPQSRSPFEPQANGGSEYMKPPCHQNQQQSIGDQPRRSEASMHAPPPYSEKR